MDVIIVSKTRMSNASCIGGVLANGRFVRLLNQNGYNQEIDTPLNIGDVWTIEFVEKENKRPPHIEDILVTKKSYKFTFETIDKMVDYLTNKLQIKIWKGSADMLFDKKIQWTDKGSGYISETGDIPDNSVGFWIPDRDLTRSDYKNKVRYSYFTQNKIETPFGDVLGEPVWKNITFVGYQNPVDIIPAGTVVRVSLARWWKPSDSEDEERCYLQLSGWYGL